MSSLWAGASPSPQNQLDEHSLSGANFSDACIVIVRLLTKSLQLILHLDMPIKLPRCSDYFICRNLSSWLGALAAASFVLTLRIISLVK